MQVQFYRYDLIDARSLKRQFKKENTNRTTDRRINSSNVQPNLSYLPFCLSFSLALSLFIWHMQKYIRSYFWVCVYIIKLLHSLCSTFDTLHYNTTSKASIQYSIVIFNFSKQNKKPVKKMCLCFCVFSLKN